MEIIYAAPETHNLTLLKNKCILLSYYDLTTRNIPFRKQTFETIKGNKKHEDQQNRIPRNPPKS